MGKLRLTRAIYIFTLLTFRCEIFTWCWFLSFQKRHIFNEIKRHNVCRVSIHSFVCCSGACSFLFDINHSDVKIFVLFCNRDMRGKIICQNKFIHLSKRIQAILYFSWLIVTKEIINIVIVKNCDCRKNASSTEEASHINSVITWRIEHLLH